MQAMLENDGVENRLLDGPVPSHDIPLDDTGHSASLKAISAADKLSALEASRVLLIRVSAVAIATIALCTVAFLLRTSVVPPSCNDSSPTSSSTPLTSPLTASPSPSLPAVTICTAFYPSSTAKHSLDDYRVWQTRFVAMHAAMVIATTPDNYPTLASVRYSKLFHNAQPADFPPETANNLAAVKLSLQADRQLSDYPTYWLLQWSDPQDIPLPLHNATTNASITDLHALYESQRSLDPERDHHTAHLYAVWSAKPYLLNLTATINPFQSEVFLWMDIGQFRTATDVYGDWPDMQQVYSVFGGGDSGEPVDGRLLYVDVTSWSREWCAAAVEDLSLEPFDSRYAAIRNLARTDRVEGGNYGGRVSAVRRYASTYYALVDRFIASDWLFGKDQVVMNSLAMGRPRDFIHMHAAQGCHNEWFFFAQFFALPADRWSDCASRVYDAQRVVRSKWTQLCWEHIPHL